MIANMFELKYQTYVYIGNWPKIRMIYPKIPPSVLTLLNTQMWAKGLKILKTILDLKVKTQFNH